VPRDAESDRWAVRPPPPATPVAAEATGTVSGTVRDGAGQPVSGALVWIQEGLEAYVFPPPAGPAVLVNRGAGFEPRFEIVRAFQPLSLRSGDDELHTAVFSDRRGKRLANYPVIPGEERSLMFDRGLGWIHVRCSAHGEAEPGCDLLVLASAFVTRTDAGGAFSFQGVPAGSLRLATRTGAQTIMGEVTVTAGGDAEALLRAVPERDSR